LDGIDVSSNQKAIDWSAVYNAGVRWAYIRLCRGVVEVDTRVAANVVDAARAGILLGVYHRVFPNLGSAEDHAMHFIAQWNRIADLAPEITIAPALDYEEPVAGGGPWCREYMDRIRNITGRAHHVLYSAGSWFGNYITPDAWEDPNVRLWVADTGRWTNATKGHPKFTHPQMFAHQYSQTGSMAGIPEAACDLDVTTGPLPLEV
jgi:GH25 family lysozyme M1 (1,4-beta-N-acetylmuramidase)